MVMLLRWRGHSVFRGQPMHLCYVDESGCTGCLPSSGSPIQPVFVLAGIVIEQAYLHDLTLDFIALKQEYFPGKRGNSSEYLDWMLVEVKGSELREYIRSEGRDRRRQVMRFLDDLLALLERNKVRIIGKLFIKGIGQPFNGTAVYTSSVQSICAHFQAYLASQQAAGMVIVDSRNKPKNTNVSHSVFTQKFRAQGDHLDRLLEMPVFGHSDNHAGIQLADLLCSAYLFPLATYSYCLGHVQSVHVHMRYSLLKEAFGGRLQKLQYRYCDRTGRWRGGITVSDAIGKQSGRELFS